jgi:two-component system, OmpR family, osmolarity sensor histidine kinase EnvZ
VKGSGVSLARHYAVMLAVFFVAFELVMAAAVVGLLMVPMARRAAGDLAGLMVLSAQTWSELPPETRPVFEVELARNHLLALRADMPAEQANPLHGPYLYFLEEALAEKAGGRLDLVAEDIEGRTWYWVSLPSGDGRIAVGLPHDRIGTQPVNAMLFSLAVALLMALAASAWLARRAVGPLARLEQAAARVGRGEVPDLLPETGPRELATLAWRFNAMARQVRDLLAARTTLLAGVSHDLRTPLARMRVALALAEKRPSPKLYARIEADIEEMDRLIGNVLDLARGLASETPVEVDLHALLGELAGSSGQVAVACPELRVMAPALALRRALGNLVDNARRYGGDGLIEVVAESWPGKIRIGVFDRGPGIPDDQVEAVFEPFHRLDAARNPALGGAGLGLAIVRQLAQANRWQIELKAREGGGLEAWLILPTQPSAAPQDA